MIIDTHVHLGTSSVYTFDFSLDYFLKTRDRYGIDMAINTPGCAIGSASYKNFDMHLDECFEAFEKSGGRIVNYFFYSPNHVDQSLRLIEDNIKSKVMVGIKIHPSDNSVYADDERYRPAFEIAKKYGLPIMSHTWSLTSNPKQKFAVPERFETFIREFPEVTFIFGHSGGRVSGIKTAVALGEKYKNAHFDIAGDILDRRLVEYIVSRVGADRLLFASDNTWFDPSVQMGQILGSGYTLEEKELMLGGNAQRIFKL